MKIEINENIRKFNYSELLIIEQYVNLIGFVMIDHKSGYYTILSKKLNRDITLGYAINKKTQTPFINFECEFDKYGDLEYIKTYNEELSKFLNVIKLFEE